MEYSGLIEKYHSIFTFLLTGFLERDWTSLTGLLLYPEVLRALGVKVHDRPIRYFFGEACHDFSLKEQAKRSQTTQRRAGLPVRNRIG